jgi:hypothetical protein
MSINLSVDIQKKAQANANDLSIILPALVYRARLCRRAVLVSPGCRLESEE